MDKQAVVRTTIAAGVAGLGLSVGGVALATADQDNATNSTPGPAAEDHGPGHREQMAGELASALGLSEDKVEAALEAVREELRPERPEDGVRPAPPTEEERAAQRAAFAKALADELDISTAKVTAALAELRADAEAEGRARLAERLDTAIEDGDLTSADKASVLKAYDAGVLGGPAGFGAGPGPGRG
jgi:Spy/CpxP family protein refolding chaperone